MTSRLPSPSSPSWGRLWSVSGLLSGAIPYATWRLHPLLRAIRLGRPLPCSTNRVFGSRNVFSGTDDQGHALVQVSRLHLQDILGASAGTASSLLGYHGQRRRFVEQAQFTRAFRISDIGRIQKDP